MVAHPADHELWLILQAKAGYDNDIVPQVEQTGRDATKTLLALNPHAHDIVQCLLFGAQGLGGPRRGHTHHRSGCEKHTA